MEVPIASPDFLLGDAIVINFAFQAAAASINIDGVI